MTNNNEKKFYATNGVDWKNEESIMEFARQIWANFVAQSDFASAENSEELTDELGNYKPNQGQKEQPNGDKDEHEK